MQQNSPLIRRIYLYLFSFVGLVVVVMGSVQIIDLGLRMYVFKDAESYIRYPAYPQKTVDGTQELVTLTPEQQAKYDQEQMEAEAKSKKSEHQRTLANSLAMILVGTPLFLYHWRLISQENKAISSSVV